MRCRLLLPALVLVSSAFASEARATTADIRSITCGEVSCHVGCPVEQVFGLDDRLV